MATMEDVYRALLKADAAGDVEAATALSRYIREQQGIALPEEPERPGFLKSIGLGTESLLSSGRTALEAALSPEEAAIAGLERRQELSKEYGEGLTLEDLKRIYEQEGLLAAAKEVASEIPSAIGEQIPNIGATVAGARLGAMAGAPLGPYGAVGGTILGAVAPSLIQQFGGNIERQAAEQQARGEPVDISAGAAAAAAVPQAALDVAAQVIPLGRTLAGRLFGKEVQALLGAGEREAAEALAKESLTATLSKGTAIGAFAEIPTEITQQALERAQAGLSLTDDDALQEYGETAFQVSLLAPIGAAGRVVERGAARRGVEEAQIEERMRAEDEARAAAERAPPAPEPTAPIAPAAPTEQMELPLEGEAVQMPLFEEPAVEPTPSLYRPAEEVMADLDLKPRSRAFKDEAKDLGLKLDRKGDLKPNQFVFQQPETEVPLTQGRFEFETPQVQPDLPMTVPPAEGQLDMFGAPMPRGGEMQIVPSRPEMPVIQEIPKEQFALDLPGVPMERLAPRDRVLRAMAISEDKKNIPNLQFATGLRPMELQKTIGDLKKEGAIGFNRKANEWELTPVGAERVRSGPEVKPPSPRRRVALPVPPSRPAEPTIAESGERGVAGVSTAPARVDVGAQQVQPALVKPTKSKVEENLNKLLENVARRGAMESQGRNILEDMEEVGETPKSVSDRFWSDTYPKLSPEGQRKFQKQLEADGFKPGSVLSYNADTGERVVAKDWRDIGNMFAEQFPESAADLEGTDRGYVSLMKWANDNVAKATPAAAAPTISGKAAPALPSPAPAAPPVDRMALIRRAAEQRVSRQAIDEVEGRRSRLRTQAIDAFENDQIDENTYTQITEQLKRPVPNFGVVEKVLSGEVKPGRRGIKFQQAEVPAAPQVAPERAQAVAVEATRNWTNAPNVVVARSVDDPVIPEPLRKRIPKDAPGFYQSGTTYVIADRAKDEAAVRGTVFHESLGHYGLEQEFQGGLRDVMQGIYDTNPKMQAAAKERMKKFDLDAATAVEEVLAERSEAGPVKESWLRSAYNKVAAYIRNFMRQRGLVSTYSDNDVNQILKQAHRRVTEGKKAPYDPFDPAVRYQRSPEAQRRGDIAFIRNIGKIPERQPAPTKTTFEEARNAASNIPSSARKGLYSMLNVHELDRMYGKFTDALSNLWSDINLEGVANRRSQEIIEANFQKWQKVMEPYSDAEKDRIYKIFMDTTVEQVEVLDLVDPSRNVNFVANKESPLYKQFSKLDPKVQQFYKELRLSYLDYSLQMEKLLQQYLAPNEWQKMLNDFNKRRLPVYLPLFRKGKYKLTYTDNEGEYVARQFESERERSLAEAAAKRDGAKDFKSSIIGTKEADVLPSTGFFGKVVGQLTKAKVDKDVIRSVVETYLDYLPSDSVLQLSRGRAGTAGFSRDVLEAYANVADSYSRRLINMEFMPKFVAHNEKLKIDMDGAVERGAIDSTVADDLVNVVGQQLDYIRNPNLNNFEAKVGYFSYQMYLGANISTAVVNTLDIPTITWSRLGGKYGFGRAFNSILKAGSTFFSKQKSPEIMAVIEQGLATGALREQQLRDIAEFKDINSQTQQFKARVERITNWAFTKSDMFNRQVTLLAAYDLAKKTPQGTFDPQAFKAAERAVYDVYGSSFPKAAPPIMGKAFARTALTFKRFAITRMNLLVSAAREAAEGEPDPAVRNAARKEILGYFGTAYVFAGVQGMPVVGAFSALVTLFNGMFGDDDEPYNPDFELREAVGLFNYKGPVNYLFGVDIASRTGWTGMFWREDPKRMAEVGPLTYAVEQLLGPAFSYASGALKKGGAIDLIMEGQMYRGLEQLSPRVVGNVMKGLRYAEEGALTAKGKPLVEDVNAYNVFMQVFGFRPSEVAEAGDVAGAAKRMEAGIRERRNAIIARAAVARLSGDMDGFRDAIEEARRFSQKNPEVEITSDTLSRAIERRARNLAMSVNGVNVDPKLARRIYGELGVEESE